MNAIALIHTWKLHRYVSWKEEHRMWLLKAEKWKGIGMKPGVGSWVPRCRWEELVLGSAARQGDLIYIFFKSKKEGVKEGFQIQRNEEFFRRWKCWLPRIVCFLSGASDYHTEYNLFSFKNKMLKPSLGFGYISNITDS